MSAHARRSVAAVVSLLALCGPWATAAADARITPAAVSLPDGGGDPAMDPAGCDLVRFYVAVNPSMNKPRGHQDQPDQWSWASGC
jgi:hypothetical protein